MNSSFKITEEDEKLTATQVANGLGVSRQTFRKYCEAGVGPDHVMIFGKKRYLASVVNKWIEDSQTDSASGVNLSKSASKAVPK